MTCLQTAGAALDAAGAEIPSQTPPKFKGEHTLYEQQRGTWPRLMRVRFLASAATVFAASFSPAA